MGQGTIRIVPATNANSYRHTVILHIPYYTYVTLLTHIQRIVVEVGSWPKRLFIDRN